MSNNEQINEQITDINCIGVEAGDSCDYKTGDLSISDSSSVSQSHWYILQMIPGFENIVQRELLRVTANTDKLEEIFIPSFSSIKERRGKKFTSTTKLMSGYMMLKIRNIDQELISIITRIENVGRFLGEKNRPTKVSEVDMGALKEQVALREKNFADVKNAYHVHETVAITSGPFEGFCAVVEHIASDKNTLRATVSIFGRDSVIELACDQIKKIENYS